MDRRRFLTIIATVTASPVLGRAWEEGAWEGAALGARARILIDHPETTAITAEAAAEIARLEGIFSLYRDSALMRLNGKGYLQAPPFELLECLALCDSVHRATGGLFDPTVQPLWAVYAEAKGHPRPETVAAVQTGWERVRYDTDVIRLDPGMGLTLNGVAQGFIADRVADLLRKRGLTHVLIDTGELAALGPQADGSSWPVRLATGGDLSLTGGALASSAPLGTVFAPGRGHILHPVTRQPAALNWSLVTISDASAAMADALSTAACLMSSREMIEAALPPSARLVHLA